MGEANSGCHQGAVEGLGHRQASRLVPGDVVPADLDLERLARATTNADEATRYGVGRDIVEAMLERQGGAARLRYYAMLFDLWAFSTWLAKAPTAVGKGSWAPSRNLVAAAEGRSWTDRAITDAAP